MQGRDVGESRVRSFANRRGGTERTTSPFIRPCVLSFVRSCNTSASALARGWMPLKSCLLVVGFVPKCVCVCVFVCVVCRQVRAHLCNCVCVEDVSMRYCHVAK